MKWQVNYIDSAYKDLKRLDNSQRLLVIKAIEKVSANPVPITMGGYGKPLGNKRVKNLTGFYKIKIRDSGLRVVYDLILKDEQMRIIIISIRTDEEVYKIAAKRASLLKKE